jgi:transketolase N-terminal domain/subunit
MKLSLREMKKMLDVWRAVGWDVPSYDGKSTKEVQVMYKEWEEAVTYSRRSISQF